MEWLKEYQSIVSGLLTLAAGSFAYFAARMQVKAEKWERQRVRKSKWCNACSFFLVSIEGLKDETEQLIERINNIVHVREKTGKL